MAFDPTEPVSGSYPNSEPMRENFIQLARHHMGAAAPPSPQLGYIWLDTAIADNWKVKIYSQDGANPAAWVTLFENVQASPPAVGIVNTVDTTNANATLLATIAIPDDAVVLIEVTIVARQTNALGDASFVRRAEVRREGGGGATLRATVSTPFSRRSDSSWVVTIAVSGNDALINVVGAIGKDISWRSVHVLNQLS